MSNQGHVQSFLDEQSAYLLIVEEVLSEWNGEGCYQFPALLGKIQLKMNWDEKQLRAKEPIIREYVRKHPDWHVTRGAHGGIMRAADKQKKEATRLAKEQAKAELTAELAKKAEALTAAQTATTAVDASQVVSE